MMGVVKKVGRRGENGGAKKGFKMHDTGCRQLLALHPASNILHPLLEDARSDKEQNFLRAAFNGAPPEKVSDDGQRTQTGDLVLLR
jgi:hypothetical protein